MARRGSATVGLDAADGYSALPVGRLHATFAIALAVLGAALVLAACGSGGSGKADKPYEPPKLLKPASAQKASKLPNVIFIYSDDQNLSDFTPDVMPETYKLLVDQGTTFDDFVVATPLCCPSRVSYLTGNYPHNSGVFANRGGYRRMDHKINTLSVWMHNAGYRTAWIGKYLQGYDMFVEDHYGIPPPGIDVWHATFEPRYYNYGISDKGERKKEGKAPNDYYTSVITDYARKTIRQGLKRKRPLYMTVNNLGPHTGSGKGGRCTDIVPPAPRDRNRFEDAKVPRTPAFNEADVSDKPSYVPRDPLTKSRIARLDLLDGCRKAALRSVDREIGSIYRAVQRAGQLNNTVFVFSSDNGVIRGQHRLAGKNAPYEEGIHMPMVMLAGKKALGGKAVSNVSELTANVDFAPTILDLANAKPCGEPGNCRPIDGRSLLPLMRGKDPGFPADRQVLIEGGKGQGQCLYSGIRSPGLSYLERDQPGADGSCERDVATELYDLDGELTGKPDPFQLDNLASPTVPASSEPAVQDSINRLHRRVEELRSCSGRSCR